MPGSALGTVDTAANSLPEDKCGEGEGSWEGEHGGCEKELYTQFYTSTTITLGHVLSDVSCEQHRAHARKPGCQGGYARRLCSPAHRPELRACAVHPCTEQHETESSTRDNDAVKSLGEQQTCKVAAGVTGRPALRKTFV